MKKPRILLAGATGYLGSHIASELQAQAYHTTLIVRNKAKLKADYHQLHVMEAEATQPHTLQGVCQGVDVVISTIGITRQKDGLTYMDVDYQANLNLLKEAQASGVKKFIYVSVLKGDQLRYLKICDAKERFVDALKASGLEYTIVRPNGFFSDMRDFLSMAKGGRIYLFGDGKLPLNPIHGADLAKVCVSAIDQNTQEINVGGPDLLSQNEIAALALQAYEKPIKITHIPDWVRRFTIWSLRTFTSSRTYGPFEFFLTGISMDMSSPQYGTHHLRDFYQAEVKRL